MTLAADAKKIAAQFSKVAKLKSLTTLLRTEVGTKITRKELKAFEKHHNLVVQWVARREDPVQTFRTPLGFVRSGRGEYEIPGVTDVPVPDRDVSYGTGDAPLSADEQAVANMLGLEAEPTEVLVNETGIPVTVTGPEVLTNPPLSAKDSTGV
jgi:hypothetical protein